MNVQRVYKALLHEGVTGQCLLEYMSHWQGGFSETMDMDVAQHPAAKIPEILASNNAEHNEANCNQIEAFMETDHAKRNEPKRNLSRLGRLEGFVINLSSARSSRTSPILYGLQGTYITPI